MALRQLRILIAGAALAGAVAASGQIAPVADHPVAHDVYHGVRVDDPHRWLEDGRDPAVKAWAAAQNAKTRAYLDTKPQHAAIAAELKRIENGFSVVDARVQVAGGRLFATTVYPGRQQPVLSTLALSGDPATRRAVLDIGKVTPAGSVAADWYVPSLDGRLVAVSLSSGGQRDRHPPPLRRRHRP